MIAILLSHKKDLVVIILTPVCLTSCVVFFLESDLTCTTTSTCDVDYVNITCVIDFFGHWNPAIEWGQCDVTDETVITADVSNSNSISPNERVTSTLTMKRNGNNGICYKATAMFKEFARPVETDAENIPSYSHTIFFRQSSDTHCRPM